MSTDPGSQLDNQPCKHLRSKEMFYDTAAPPDQQHGSGIFWCTRTDNCLGSDGKPAADDECDPQRECYEQQ